MGVRIFTDFVTSMEEQLGAQGDVTCAMCSLGAKYCLHLFFNGELSWRNITGCISKNGIKNACTAILHFNFSSPPPLKKKFQRQVWVLPFCAYCLCYHQSHHEQGCNVCEKCLIHHKATFFCSSLAESEATWLHPEELRFEADTYLVCVDVCVCACGYWWNNEMKPADGNGCTFGISLAWFSFKRSRVCVTCVDGAYFPKCNGLYACKYITWIKTCLKKEKKL